MSYLGTTQTLFVKEVSNEGAYLDGHDTQKVKSLLLECVDKQKGVLKNPNPFVLFEDFGDSALLFGVYFYIGDSFTDPKIKSELRFKIDDSFRQNGISIPFPQRDTHVIPNQPKT